MTPDEVKRWAAEHERDRSFRAWIQNKARAAGGELRRVASEIGESVMGAPGSPYGEVMGSLVAGARSALPGGAPYREELQRIRDAREERYPGAYSVVPEARQAARRAALTDEMVGAGVGIMAPVKNVFHAPTPPTPIRARLYHGTKADLGGGLPDPDMGTSVKGVWLTPKRKHAAVFGTPSAYDVEFKRPLVIRADHPRFAKDGDWALADLAEKAKRAGYDGLVIMNGEYGVPNYIALEPWTITAAAKKTSKR